MRPAVVGSSHVSIRAPARGATSCSHTGQTQADVSIRAPARGATILWLRRMGCRHRFNSRSREGSDGAPCATNTPSQRFNSRSREGSDSMACAYGIRLRSFNSRSREGSDKGRDWLIEGGLVSIRAPARGATP